VVVAPSTQFLQAYPSIRHPASSCSNQPTYQHARPRLQQLSKRLAYPGALSKPRLGWPKFMGICITETSRSSANDLLISLSAVFNSESEVKSLLQSVRNNTRDWNDEVGIFRRNTRLLVTQCTPPISQLHVILPYPHFPPQRLGCYQVCARRALGGTAADAWAGR
jgi:hypothetical protein